MERDVIIMAVDFHKEITEDADFNLEFGEEIQLHEHGLNEEK